MTAAQNRVYSAIKKFIDTNGYSPTFKQIGDIAGLTSLSTIHNHIRRLMRDGYLVTTSKGEMRSLEISPDKRLRGFRRCELGHEIVFFISDSCPCCKIILGSARQVEVSKHS